MKIKLLSILLVLATLLSCFVGCSPEQDTSGTGNEPSGDTQPGAEGLLEIANKDKAIFSIVYPIGASEKMVAQAESIRDLIKTYTGTSVKVAHDSEKASEHEIRIGRVARMDAMDVYKTYNSFVKNDFAVELVGGHIYIYGKNDVAINAAIQYFLEKAIAVNEDAQTVSIADDYKLHYIEDKNPPIGDVSNDDTYLYFTMAKGTLTETYVRVCFTGKDTGWRIQTKKNTYEEFDDIGASQRLSLSLGELPALNVEKLTFKTEGDYMTATASDGSAAKLNTKNFSLQFLTPSGKNASTISSISSGAGGSYIEGDLQAKEAIFGTGERFDSTNQRGKNINMFTKDVWSKANACYMVIPLLCFSRGSGVFLNIYEEMNLDLGNKGFGENDTWSASVVEAEIDCYIFTCERMSDAIYGYSCLSGFAGKPEEWSYGMIICRYGPELSQKWSTSISASEKQDGREYGVYDTIAMMEAYDLPWTGILAEGWGYSKEDKHQDLKELCDYVHSLGKKFLVYMAVGYASYDMRGYTNDYLMTMTTPSGQEISQLPFASTNNPDAQGGRGRYYLDVTDPVAVKWFFEEYWESMKNEIGVDGCKIDFCEGVPEYYQLNFYDLNAETSGSHHWYPTAFCAMFWEMIADKPDSGMCYTRGGGIGSQRAPYMWAGDQKRCFESLDFQLTACLSSGMSGVPFMSYDMSGYQYGDASTDPYDEAHAFVRGLQYTAFTICMQQHGKVRQAFEFTYGQYLKEYKNKDWVVVKDKDGNPVYKIKPGEMSYVTDIYRGYVKLHELLTPYITKYTEEACTTGMPVMRILALEWQNDTNVYRIDDEYMFGEDFLVAPILDGSYKRDVYLPEGNWLDLNNPDAEPIVVGKEGKTITCQATLAQMPLFCRLDENMEPMTDLAKELLPGIREIMDYINSIDLTDWYAKTTK